MRQLQAWILAGVLLMVGCAGIPSGGYYGDMSRLGTPGPVLTTVSVGEGLVVRLVSMGGTFSKSMVTVTW